MMEKIRQAREAYANWAKKGNDKEEEDAAKKAKEAAEIAEQAVASSTQGVLEDSHTVDEDAPEFIAGKKFNGAKKATCSKPAIKDGYYLDLRYRKRREVNQLLLRYQALRAPIRRRRFPPTILVKRVSNWLCRPIVSVKTCALTLLIQVESIDEKSGMLFSSQAVSSFLSQQGRSAMVFACARQQIRHCSRHRVDSIFQTEIWRSSLRRSRLRSGVPK